MIFEQVSSGPTAAGQMPRWRQLRRRDLACIASGLAVIALVLIAALFAALGLLPHDPEEMNLNAVMVLPLREGYLLGTDYIGRDLLSRLLPAIHAWLFPGLLAVVIALVLGIAMGIVSGYREGRAATLIDYIGNLLDSFPRLMLILLVVAALKADIWLIMTVVGLTAAPMVAVIISSRIRTLKQKNFVESAVALGIPVPVIIFKHLLWYNCRALLLIQATFIMAEAIMIETTLSYLGFGVQEPDPSWGNMIQSGAPYLLQGEFWPSTAPALAIMITVLGLQLLGHGLHNVLENRLR